MTQPARPRVRLHFAQSLDGRIAHAGSRLLLSSNEGLVLAHRARAEHDAVLVGRGTVAIDDPRLTVRACDGPQPRRIVLASTLDIPPTAQVLDGGPGILVIGVSGRASHTARLRLEHAGAEVRLVEAGDGGWVSLGAALAEIRAWGVDRLLVEGGAAVLTSFLRARMADEVTIEIAPRLIGDPGVVALGAFGSSALALSAMVVERAGESVVVRGTLAY